MSPFSRHVTIGLAASACVLAASSALWWTTFRDRDDLASVVPAEAVLAYVELPDADGSLRRLLELLSPDLPQAPDMDARASAAAAVRLPDGTEGWIIRLTNEFGAVRFAGSDPTLETLIHAPGTPLADDQSFQRLRWNAPLSWAYVAFPRASSTRSPLAGMLALDAPVALRATASGMTIRQRAERTRGIAGWPGMVAAPSWKPEQTILLPSWSDMAAVAPLLSDAARDVAETTARTFLDSHADGLSVRYDMAILLHAPSVLSIGTDGSGGTLFSLEGRGRTPEDTERTLRSIHEHASAQRGNTLVRTVSAEGYSFRTISYEGGNSTTERTDGEWNVLETRMQNGVLMSARNGPRFVLTTAPDAFSPTAAARPAPTATELTWNAEASARILPLWPTLRPAGGTLRSTLSGGPGFVEWTLEPVIGL